jgi:predicted PurR-regulated permease PerM
MSPTSAERDAAREPQANRRRGNRRRAERRGPDHGQTAAGERFWRDLHRPARVLVYLVIALVLIGIYQQAQFLVAKIFGVLLLFLFAAIIAMLLNPLVDRIEQVSFLRGRRGLAVLVTNLILILALATLLAVLIPLIASQSQAFGDEAPVLLRKVQSYLDGVQSGLNRAGIPLHLGIPSDVGSLLGPAVGSAVSIVSGAIGAIVNLVLVAVISIFLQMEGRQLIAALRQVFPRQQEIFDFALVAAGSTLAGYVRGQIIFAAVMSVYTGVILSLIGVHFALVIAVITFFLELVPIIGAPAAMGLAVVIAALQSPLILALTAVFTLIGHLVGAYTVGLRVMSRATRVHPLVALGALLLGAELGGILGAIFAVPIAGILNVYLGAIYRARRGQEAFTLPDTAVHDESTLDQLPRLGQEITELAQEEEITKEPIPRAKGRPASP